MATTLLTAPSAKAATFSETITTTDPINGYVITLNGLTTDVNNVAQSQTSANIVGYGADNAWVGPLALITPLSSEGVILQGNVFNFDGKAFAAAPYFSNTSSSGIVEALTLGSTILYFNPYDGGVTYYDSTSTNGGAPSNPGDIITINPGATPLPASLPLFAGGLGVLGLLARKRKQRHVTSKTAFA